MQRLQRDGDNTSSVFQRLGRAWNNNRQGIASLDNQMRGLGLLLVIGFSQQLITVLGGLGGAFIAVASSAAQAGAAVGGMFVAGIAQALPMIGLLGAAMSRVSSVMDAVKQAQTTQQQQAVQGATANRRVADSADAVANAEESAADAHRRVKEAQEDLTKARQEAREELEDLIQAENDAKLAAVGAALSQAEAQQALIKAQAQGDVGGIQRAQLALLQAQSDAHEKVA